MAPFSRSPSDFEKPALMGDIKFSCPNCNQHITCDELWGEHELPCPSCQTPLVVPAPAGRPAPAAATGGGSLVPKPPQGGSRLSKAPTQDPAAAQAQPRGIPIRNLAPPPTKKKNPFIKILTTAAVVIVVGVGCY